MNCTGAYGWCDGAKPWEVAIEDLPPFLEAMISSASVESPGTYTSIDVIRYLQGFSEGERDDRLYELASSFRARNYPFQSAVNLITEAARQCDPPFDEGTAEKMVQRAYKKYPAGT